MRPFAAAATVLALAAVAAVAIARWDEVAGALAAIPLWAFAVATSLHLGTLILRSEAWRLVLTAAGGAPVSRTAIHTANAGAFVAGAAQSHAAMPVRIALLAGRDVRTKHLLVADVPIVAVEAACTGVLLALASFAVEPWWLGPVTLAATGALLVGARALAGRAKGLAILADVRLRSLLLGVMGTVIALFAARVWLLLAVTDLPADVGTVAVLVGSLGIFGLLPLGPGASPSAALATVGGSGVAAALVLGLAISATSICAVVLYAAATVIPRWVRVAARVRTARA
jgi:hypothetical protein